MTTNNEVKAPRPCTLPEGWIFKYERTSLDVSEIYEVNHVHYQDSNYGVLIRDRKGNCLALCKLNFDETTEQDLIHRTIQAKIQEIIQAIAFAHRPWLKAEGFEFVEGEWYEALHIHGGTLIHDMGEFGKYGEVQGIDSSNFADVGYIKAFKPVILYNPADTQQHRLTKEQEAWDAVAGVEAWEG